MVTISQSLEIVVLGLADRRQELMMAKAWHGAASCPRRTVSILLCFVHFLLIQASSAFSTFHGEKGNIIPSRLHVVSDIEASTKSENFAGNDQIQLFSLKWTPDDCISKPVRDVWRWKDASLGDGRDFFVPKPKTIRSLQDYIIGKLPSISECMVVSNCARLEILCVTKHKNDNLSEELARCLAAQVFARRSNRPQLLQTMLVQHMDLPEMAIDQNVEITPMCFEYASAISKHWLHISGCEAVSRHLCLVAAGIAPRPRRPDREVIFRPFSSRDSHILLQLKRTKDAATGKALNTLIEYALRAGKAVRTVEQVPEIEMLREYGSGDSKYSTGAPLVLSRQVAEVRIFDIDKLQIWPFCLYFNCKPQCLTGLLHSISCVKY